MKKRNLAVVTAVVGLLLSGASLHARSALRWESDRPDHTPTPKTLVPEMGGKEAYSERYEFEAALEGGGRLKMAWTISNLGWGDGRGAAQVELHLPGREPYDFGKKVGRGKWSFQKEPFQIKIAGTTLRVAGNDTFKLTHDGKIRIETTFKSRLPMWSPGRLVHKKGYRHVTLICPRADVEGRILLDGEWKKIRSNGAGYADHPAMTLPPHKMAVRFSRFHAFQDDTTIVWKGLDPTKKFGGRRIAWIMVGEGDRIVFHDLDADLKFGDHQKDPATGYRIPREIETTGRSGQDRISIVQKAGNYRRTDLLAKYGTFAQLIAGAVATPYRFEQDARFTCKKTIDGTTGTTECSGELVMDFLHK
jgi:hypothetical protein